METACESCGVVTTGPVLASFAPPMPRLPTASGLTRALACPTSCVLTQTTSSESSHASLGRQVHTFLERVAKGEGVACAVLGLSSEAKAFAEAIDLERLPVDLLSGGWDAEVPFSYDLDSGEGRRLDAASGRVYGAVPASTVVGTADLVRVAGDAVLVVDAKTGRGWLPPPGQSGQLRFLALAAATAHGASEAIVGHLSLRPDGSTWLEVETLDALELGLVREQLQDARRAVESRHVAPREGAWCRYCPAFNVCPAKAALAAAVVQAPPVLSPETAAAAWKRLREVKAVLGRVEDALREYAEQAPVPLGDGLELAAVTTLRETYDAGIAQQVVREMYGDEVAAGVVELSTTKGRIEAAVRTGLAALKAGGKKLPKGLTQKTALQQLQAVIAGRDGVTLFTRLEVRERKVSAQAEGDE
jgi:hypothetical protein